MGDLFLFRSKMESRFLYSGFALLPKRPGFFLGSSIPMLAKPHFNKLSRRKQAGKPHEAAALPFSEGHE